MRYSDANFFANYSTVDLAALLASSPSGGSSDKGAIIGGVVGGVGGILIIGLLLFMWRTKFSKPKAARRGGILAATELQGPVTSLTRISSLPQRISVRKINWEKEVLEIYTSLLHRRSYLLVLHSATIEFASLFWCGVLRNGNVVAVKKLAIAQSSRIKADFKSEVKLISNVHHQSLVRLLGCSSKGPELLLVYEYVANSSLDKFLFGAWRGTLNWKQRSI